MCVFQTLKEQKVGAGGKGISDVSITSGDKDRELFAYLTINITALSIYRVTFYTTVYTCCIGATLLTTCTKVNNSD